MLALREHCLTPDYNISHPHSSSLIRQKSVSALRERFLSPDQKTSTPFQLSLRKEESASAFREYFSPPNQKTSTPLTEKLGGVKSASDIRSEPENASSPARKLITSSLPFNQDLFEHQTQKDSTESSEIASEKPFNSPNIINGRSALAERQISIATSSKDPVSSYSLGSNLQSKLAGERLSQLPLESLRSAKASSDRSDKASDAPKPESSVAFQQSDNSDSTATLSISALQNRARNQSESRLRHTSFDTFLHTVAFLNKAEKRALAASDVKVSTTLLDYHLVSVCTEMRRAFYTPEFQRLDVVPEMHGSSSDIQVKRGANIQQYMTERPQALKDTQSEPALTPIEI